jgi:hypothetical protein
VRRAVRGQDFDDVADVAALVRTRVELAVAVCSCAAFTEAVVGVGVDDAVLREAFEIATARLDGLAAVENDGWDAGARELVRAEDAGGSGTDDDDGWAGGLAEGRAAQGVVGFGDADHVVEADATAACVDGTCADFDRREFFGGGADLGGELARDGGRVVGLVELELDGVVAIGLEYRRQLRSSSFESEGR